MHRAISTAPPPVTVLYGGGTAFILTPSGVEKVLFDFNGANGNFPASTLVPDMQGNLFGTTFRGGAYGYGMIFTVSPTAKSKVVYSFTGGADGEILLAA